MSSRGPSSEAEIAIVEENTTEKEVRFENQSGTNRQGTKVIKKKSTRFFDDDKDLGEVMDDYLRDEWVAKLDEAAKQAKKDAYMFYRNALKHIKHLPPHTPLVLNL